MLGHNLRYFLCGGAALDPELIRFFKYLGITVLQGYGITECSPIVAANPPGANRIGSIGRTFPCCETAIIDGEICVRGGSVSPGYYHDEAATAKSFRNGWFHTGDLGRVNKRGFLYFQGRMKNLIVLANGENVSPEELETRLYQIDGVRDAIVYKKTSRSQPRSTPIPPCSRTRQPCGKPSVRSTGICRPISRSATSFSGKTNLKKP